MRYNFYSELREQLKKSTYEKKSRREDKESLLDSKKYERFPELLVEIKIQTIQKYLNV